MGTPIPLVVRAIGILLLLVASAVWPRAAFAQGYGGLIPEPIRLCEIGTWFETRLDRRVHADEREAILAAHQTYWMAYRSFAERDWDPFNAREAEAWKNPSALPERARKIAAAARAVEELDRVLFEAISVAIPERDREPFASVRRARSIERLLATDRLGLGMEGLPPTIVSEILLLRDFTPDARRAMRPILLAHEARVEAILREVKASTDRFVDRLADAVQRRVAAGESVTAAYPPARSEVIAAMGDWTAPRRRLVTALTTCRAEFASVASFDLAREFAWRRFGRQHDGSSVFFDPLSTERRFRLTMRASKDAAERERIGEAYRAWAKEDDAFVDRLLHRLADPDDAQRVLGETQAIWEERQAIGTRGMEALRAIASDPARIDDRFYRTPLFGPRATAELAPPRGAERPADPERAPEPEPEPGSEPEPEPGEALEALTSADAKFASADSAKRYRMNWRPEPISVDAVLAWYPEATDAERTAVRQVLLDSSDRWQREVLEPYEAIQRREQTQMGLVWGALHREQANAGAEVPQQPAERPGREVFVDLGEELAAHFDRMAAFDAALFDDMAAVLTPPADADAAAAGASARRLTDSISLARCERALSLWADSEELLGVDWGHEVLPNLPTLLRTEVPAEHQLWVGQAIAAATPQWIELARERRLLRARRDIVQTWRNGEGMVRQEELRKRFEKRHGEDAPTESPEAIQKAWEEMAAWWTADESAADARVRYTAQSREWRSRFAALLDRLAQESEGRFTSDQRLEIELAYERMVAPNRFHEIRDPRAFFVRATRMLRNDPVRSAAVTTLKTESDRDTARWTLDRLAAMRARVPVLRPGTNLDEGSGMAELRFRLDRIERFTAAAWQLASILREDELDQIPALRDYNRLCVLAGTTWWNE